MQGHSPTLRIQRARVTGAVAPCLELLTVSCLLLGVFVASVALVFAGLFAVMTLIFLRRTTGSTDRALMLLGLALLSVLGSTPTV